MKKFMLMVFIVCLLFNLLILNARSEWYENGTLHSSTVTDWNKATYKNKLATAADWSISRPQIKAKVKKSRSFETLRPFAVELVTCVNEAAAGEGYGNTSVAELAAGCMILMGW